MYRKDYKDVGVNFGHAAKLVWTKANEEMKDFRLRLPAALKKREEGIEEDVLVCELDCVLGERSS